jgi:hypothetical protein
MVPYFLLWLFIHLFIFIVCWSLLVKNTQEHGWALWLKPAIPSNSGDRGQED